MNKENVLLDLDETIISGQGTDEIDFKKDKEQLLKFPRFFDMEHEYIIIERPKLQDFLTKLFNKYVCMDSCIFWIYVIYCK